MLFIKNKNRFRASLIGLTVLSFSVGTLSGYVISNSLKPKEVYARTTQTIRPELPKLVQETNQVEEPIQEEEPKEEPELISLGTYKITAYCACLKCCGKTDGITSTGVKAMANHTIAVDPKIIPYGSTVVINGNEYRAEDCGSAIKGNRIDIYFDTHEEALNFGVQQLDVYLKGW